MKNYDVAAVGELLIDFTENGVSAQGNPLFEANPGGAPCNVLSMLQRFGHKTAFIGKVGADFFGRQLREAVCETGIDARALLEDDKIPTTLAMVHTLPDGDREFSFYREPGADMMLTREEIPADLVRDCRIFHFGTLSMTHDGVQRATEFAVEQAHDAGALLSFDPNLRFPLWSDEGRLRACVEYGLGHCDVLKISDNEIRWLTGETDYSKGVRRIKERHDIRLILVSMGREGSRAYCGDGMVEVPAYLRNDTVETTGAGDTFMGTVLHYVLKYGLDGLDKERLAEMLDTANLAASIVTTRKGALRVMPTMEELAAAKNYMVS